MNHEVSKLFFIINKVSGSGYTTALEDGIARMAGERHIDYRLSFTEAPGHATLLARQALEAGYEEIIAVGGDGTVNEVAQALLGTTAKMGILPKGSGNGLARHLGIPLETGLALQCLFTGQEIAMDCFRINGRLSVNVSGIGFDGHIAQLFGADKKRGLQGYTRLVLHEFRHFREFGVHVKTGTDKINCQAFVVAIANSSQYGNNARIAPAASVRDAILNVSILRKFPPYRLDFVYSFFSGTIDQSAYCRTLQVQQAHIQLDAPAPFHVDGEYAGTADRFTIEILPGSLNMVAPCHRVNF